MVMLKGEHIYLRALEPEDLDFVYQIENDTSLWELSDTQLAVVKMELLRMNNKLTTEQNFRLIAEGSDTPLAEQYGG